MFHYTNTMRKKGQANGTVCISNVRGKYVYMLENRLNESLTNTLIALLLTYSYFSYALFRTTMNNLEGHAS